MESTHTHTHTHKLTRAYNERIHVTFPHRTHSTSTLILARRTPIDLHSTRYLRGDPSES